MGETAYYWFDQAADVPQPDPDELAEVAAAFDDIYAALYASFGVAQPPGGRAHIAVSYTHLTLPTSDLV